jgi:hypothetical protein
MAQKKGKAEIEELEETVDDVSLGSRDQQFMERVMRFLVAVQVPRRALRARREGYTAEEHTLGWKLWRKAAGEDRSLDEYFAEVRGSEESPEHVRILRELDSFENTWFPRVRAIIRRVVPSEARDEFELAFFKDLAQQPLGPAVVGSVSALLARVEGLAKSAQAGAPAVAKTLATRGLDAHKIAQVRALIATLENRPSAAGVKVDAASIRKAQQEQLDAFAQLRDWFNDWSVTLRSVFTPQEQIRMGLVVVTRRPDGEDAEPGRVSPNDGLTSAATAQPG